jgi:hypothetical protein
MTRGAFSIYCEGLQLLPVLIAVAFLERGRLARSLTPAAGHPGSILTAAT